MSDSTPQVGFPHEGMARPHEPDKKRCLRFEAFDGKAFALLDGWFRDTELRRRLNPPDEEWLAYVTSTEGVCAFSVWEDDTCVAQLQMDTTDRTGFVKIAVNPVLRGQGYCKRVIAKFLGHPVVAGLLTLEAHIEPDNTASIRCFESLGFVRKPEQEEGFEVLVYACAESQINFGTIRGETP